MRAYRFLAYTIAVLVVVQAGAIAWAFFGMTDWITNENGVVDKACWSAPTASQRFTAEWGFAIHMFFNGLVLIPLMSLVLLIVSFFAKVPGGVMLALAICGSSCCRSSCCRCCRVRSTRASARCTASTRWCCWASRGRARAASASAPVPTAATHGTHRSPARPDAGGGARRRAA